jgi:hypothetical protein
MELRCARCGSQKIIPRRSIEVQGRNSNGTLRAFVGYDNPEAWVFKGAVYAQLQVSICGECGHAELTAQDAASLYEAYVKTNAESLRETNAEPSREWKVRIGEGQQWKIKRRAIYDVFCRQRVGHGSASRAADAFRSGRQAEVAVRDSQTAQVIVAELQALGISAEVVEPQGSQEAAAGP